MQAIFRHQTVEVWQICRDLSDAPAWVRASFDKQALVWVGERLRIVGPALALPEGGIPADWISNSGWAAGHVMADLGDVLDVTRGRVVSASYFAKYYQVKAVSE